MACRKLTRKERAAIRKQVTGMCANYDREYGCLPLDCECYMLNKWWTGAYCKYFENAVLPLDPVLAISLSNTIMPDTKNCTICGAAFMQEGKKRYCSPACAEAAKRNRQREYMRKNRGE